jgi:nucleoside-diphosphate-sugar epimerase
MKVLVLGATGFIGGAVARRLRAAGHSVSGLARNVAGADRLSESDIVPVKGDLEEGLEIAVAAGAQFDAVIFAPQLLLEPEHMAVSAFLDRLAGTGKTFVFTSGTGVLSHRTEGAWSEDTFAEADEFVPARTLVRRVETETLVRAAADRGVRGVVVRPPLVWGPGDHGHIASVYRSVGKTGAACYIGEGLNCYSNVHIDDLAHLYALVLEKGVAGALYHAVAGEIPNRWIADAVAKDLGCPTQSVSLTEAFDIWGKFAALIVMGASSRSRSPRSRKELGWTPVHRDMLVQIGEPRFQAMARLDTAQGA